MFQRAAGHLPGSQWARWVIFQGGRKRPGLGLCPLAWLPGNVLPWVHARRSHMRNCVPPAAAWGDGEAALHPAPQACVSSQRGAAVVWPRGGSGPAYGEEDRGPL